MSSVETQFHVPPFPPFPSASRYVRVGSQDEALQRVRHAVEAWEAISLVIGPPGTGKSLICQVLQQYFSRDREVIVFGDTTLESPLSLQRPLLSRLDRIRGIAPTPPALGDDPQLAIIERIAGSSKEFAGLLLLVDEAQSLRPEVLETIRILTNVMSDGRPRVSAVLLGGPQLDETLALPSLDALVQRVATRCYLHPLSSDETVRYVRRAIDNAGEAAQFAIDEEAIRCIHSACSGVPRLVNQLMTAAISFASSKQQTQITTKIVDGAWSVLQQLPGPLLDEPELSRPVSDVEFGPLRDGEDVTFETSELSELPNDLPSVGHNTDDHSQCTENLRNCDAVEHEQEIEDPEFTVQTDVAYSCDDASQFGAVSVDCQSPCDFDYENITARQVNEESPESTLEPNSTLETPSPDELFGDFDDEEPVTDSAETPTLRIRDEPDSEADTDHMVESTEVETALHQEVLNLRAAAAPVLWVEEADDDELVHDDRDMLVIEDDIDVENPVIVKEIPTDAPAEPSVAIDFHAMLAKMRTSKR